MARGRHHVAISRALSGGTILVLALALLAPAAGAQSPPPGGVVVPGASQLLDVSPPVAWTRVQPPTAPKGVELRDIVAGGAGFVAVGGGWPDGATDPVAAIWTSVDGVTWDAVALEGEAAVGEIRSVAVTPFGLVAVGGQCCPDRAAVWVSQDGLDWQRLETVDAFANTAMYGVTSFDGGLVAVGCSAVMECMSGVAWVSPDGFTWTGPTLLDFLPMHVAPHPEGVIAVGGTEPYGGSIAAATSSDGLEWSAVDLPDQSGHLNAVTTLEGFTIAAGTGARPRTGRLRGMVVVPGEGPAWVAIADMPGPAFEDVLAIGGPGPEDVSLLLVGWTSLSDGRQRPATWWATLGEDWTSGTLPKGVGAIHAAAVSADLTVAVAVGFSVQKGATVPSVWYSGEPLPDVSPTPPPQRTSPPTATPAPRTTAAEQYLLSALPDRVRGTCVPRTENLPDGTIGAIDCYPKDVAVQAAAYYLMDYDDADAVFERRVDEHLTRKQQRDDEATCSNDQPSVPSNHSTGSSARYMCYYDDEGRPNLRLVTDGCHLGPLKLDGRVLEVPRVYYAVLGYASEDIPTLSAAMDRARLGWDYPDAREHNVLGCP